MGLLLGVAPVRAQTAPAETSWSDPPVRGSASPEAPSSVKPIESKPSLTSPAAAEKSASPDAAKPTRSADAPPTTPAQRAAATLGVKPVGARQNAAASASTPQARRSIVRPRMVERPLVITRRTARSAERSSRRQAQRMTRRSIRSYAFVPENQSYDSVDPDDERAYGSTGSNRRLAGWGGLVEESRASRIARARESGYSVMRMRTYAYPDGIQVQRLTPLDGGAFGDLD
ncbi:hypothetical protein [Methylobacterium haplocladii]|uniref:hypothetical protein n=1 Tax=Methylobacterium haplocladii TaxID=1176176 RepID=UPI001EE0BD6B|nr:hypothetical protein [Methylobacterium haplocladii]